MRYEQPNALNIPGTTSNEITTDYCAAEEAAFGGSSFSNHGGLPQMSDALSKGMVLVMSIWDDVSFEHAQTNKIPDGWMESSRED